MQEASGIFDGIAQQSFKILNKINIDLQFYFQDSYFNKIKKDLLNLDNIGIITVEEYLYKLPKFWNFYFENLENLISIKKETILVSSENLSLKNMNFVFSGFRDENLKNNVESKGGKVLSSISSSCSALIVKDKNKSTSKIENAKKLNIPVWSLEEFLIKIEEI